MRKGPATYTYVRCVTRLNKKQSDVSSEYVWAKNISGNGYYKLNGYWWSGNMFQWKNMFYADATYDQLEEICKKTLSTQGKAINDLLVYAADNQFSFDHTIWSINYDEKAVRKNGAFERIITFGDSLSDNSNVFNASDWKMLNVKSWYHGHFSNGYVWHEHLAKKLGIHSYNWAVGGARTENYPIAGIVTIPGIDSQIDSFVSYMKEDRNYKPGRSLFSVMAGGNDLMNGDVAPEDMVHNIDRGVKRLLSLGAKSIIVMTAPDVSLVPDMQGKTDSERLQLKENVRILNNGIKRLVDNYSRENKNADIYLVDVASIFNDIVANPADYDIADVRNACLNITPGTWLPAYLYHYTPTDACRKGKAHLFWDRIHPTTLVHENIAVRIMAAIIQHYRLSINPQ